MNSLATKNNGVSAEGVSSSGLSAARECLRLTIGLGFLWLVLSYPAFRIAGSRGLEGLSYAALLCLFPGCLALMMSGSLSHGNANATNSVLASTGLRLVIAGAVAVLMQSIRPDLRFWQFHVWLVVFYCSALALETRFLLKGIPPRSDRSPS